MKKLIASALLSAVCILSLAQGFRPVQGRVVNGDGTPMPGVTITVKGSNVSFTSDSSGNFKAEIPYGYNYLTATFTDYLPQTLEVDGSYLIFKLKYDIEGVKRRIEAEAKAEFDKIAAEINARKEAEERAAAEEAAKARAENERAAAEEKARKEAEAKARAEEAARVKAEKKRIAAEEKARKKAEAQAKAEEVARVKAEKDQAYNEKYKNKGLAHSFEFGYNPEILDGTMIYKYSGSRDYNSLHPLYATYTLSWKFNHSVSLGVGAGVLCNLKSFSIEGDEFIFNDDQHDGFREIRMDVPVFINVRTWFCRTGVRPFIDVKAGYYCLSGTLAADLGIGCEFRLSRSCSMHILAGAAFTPVPYFMYGGFTKGTGFIIPALADKGYKSTLTPSLKLGIDF